MRPLFTVHAGEFLVGCEIEKRIRRTAVWVPSKDTGIDLLVTGNRSQRPVSLQVKYSRDYSTNEPEFAAFGWWTLDLHAIRNSIADLWVFVLLPFQPNRSLATRNIEYVILPPKELARRLTRIHGRGKKLHAYLCVTKNSECWEGRGLKTSEKRLIAVGQSDGIAKQRDFTPYLNAWRLVRKALQAKQVLVRVTAKKQQRGSPYRQEC